MPCLLTNAKYTYCTQFILQFLNVDVKELAFCREMFGHFNFHSPVSHNVVNNL